MSGDAWKEGGIDATGNDAFFRLFPNSSSYKLKHAQ